MRRTAKEAVTFILERDGQSRPRWTTTDDGDIRRTRHVDRPPSSGRPCTLGVSTFSPGQRQHLGREARPQRHQ